jgi:hypothetical protein
VDDRIDAKLDKISDHIANIDVTLAKQEVSLHEHIRRTTLLEQKIEPVEKHVLMINGALKFAGIVAVFIGIIEGILRIFVG